MSTEERDRVAEARIAAINAQCICNRNVIVADFDPDPNCPIHGRERESAAPGAASGLQQRYDDLLASIVLYIGWRYVTKQLTTPQKELFADALERHGVRVHGPDGEDPEPDLAGLPSYAPRWWRDDYVEATR